MFLRLKILLEFEIFGELQGFRRNGYVLFFYFISVNEDLCVSWKGNVVESKDFEQGLFYMLIQIIWQWFFNGFFGESYFYFYYQ